MKVIGSTIGGFILQASADEVANLLGYFYTSAIPNKPGWGRQKIEVGDEIQLGKAFEKIRYLSSERRTCERTALELENLAARLRLADPVVRAVAIAGEEAKDDGEF